MKEQNKDFHSFKSKFLFNQKRNLLTLFMGLFSINFVSAYNGFSLGDMLGSIESSTMILGVVFIVSFSILFFSLSRVFKDRYGEPNKGIAGVVAFALSLLITYGLNKTGFDIEGLFFDIGISTDILIIILPLIFLVGAIFLIWKFRGNSLFILGGFFILLSFFIYEKMIAIIIGVILILIGLFLLFKKKGLGRGSFRSNYPNPRQEYRRELKEGQYQEGFRQAGIKARAKNIANIQRERLKRDAERERRRQKQAIQQQRKQITSNLQSLIRTYNEIQRKNPNDPKLQELTREIKRLKSQR